MFCLPTIISYLPAFEFLHVFFFFFFFFNFLFTAFAMTSRGLSSLWTYGSWINNYLCNQCLSPL